MIEERKRFFVDELKRHYRDIISGAHRAETNAAETAGAIQAEARRKEDADNAVEYGRLATGHRKRRERARREIEALIAFEKQGLKGQPPDAPIALGALVDVSVEGDDGPEERTLFLLPVGAGTELQGPGGDGFVSVVTPASPVGRRLTGARAGDCFEVVIHGSDREWSVVDVC